LVGPHQKRKKVRRTGSNRILSVGGSAPKRKRVVYDHAASKDQVEGKGKRAQRSDSCQILEKEKGGEEIGGGSALTRVDDRTKPLWK